ncbi:hypothetical protein E2320_002078 [Naja naja]|nr:hypothetical protein E2320_002078 [Naja naja]
MPKWPYILPDVQPPAPSQLQQPQAKDRLWGCGEAAQLVTVSPLSAPPPPTAPAMGRESGERTLEDEIGGRNRASHMCSRVKRQTWTGLPPPCHLPPLAFTCYSAVASEDRGIGRGTQSSPADVPSSYPAACPIPAAVATGKQSQTVGMERVGGQLLSPSNELDHMLPHASAYCLGPAWWLQHPRPTCTVCPVEPLS